jgi:hypothetical protein
MLGPAEVIMLGLSAVHLLIFGTIAIVPFGPWLERYIRQSRRRNVIIIHQHRGTAMREYFKKFLWTSKFWALLGLVGCVSGLYFQRVAANGSGLWCLGLMFLGAAYLEKQE